jgi:hypothetical protein
LEAKIVLKYADAKSAEVVAKAVSPDNFKTPAGLTVKTFKNDKEVVTEILCDGKLATFTATIDDLLFCVSTAEKTLKILDRTK